MNSLVNDSRVIEFVDLAPNNEDGAYYDARPKRQHLTYPGIVDTIEAYEEPGMGCMEPWIRVSKGGVIVARFAARMAVIHYAEETPDDE